MTKVPRRRPASEPWPTQAEPEARVTTSGKVSCLPSPVQAMWAEAVGRRLELTKVVDDELAGELDGIAVGLSILTCSPLEEIRAEIDRRAHVPVSRSSR